MLSRHGRMPLRFCMLLQEDEGLRVKLEKEPTKLVHFVVDLHSLQAHADDIEWTAYEENDLLMVVDTRVKDPSAHMAPMVRMVVTCSVLLGEIERIEGILAHRREKNLAIC